LKHETQHPQRLQRITRPFQQDRAWEMENGNAKIIKEKTIGLKVA